jgi:hypothetical protein
MKKDIFFYRTRHASKANPNPNHNPNAKPNPISKNPILKAQATMQMQKTKVPRHRCEERDAKTEEAGGSNQPRMRKVVHDTLLTLPSMQCDTHKLDFSALYKGTYESSSDPCLSIWRDQTRHTPRETFEDESQWMSDLGKTTSEKQSHNQQMGSIVKDHILSMQLAALMSHSCVMASNVQQWVKTLDLVKRYIASNSQLPDVASKEPETKQLGQWVLGQRRDYKKQTDMMKEQTIRAYWENFMNQWPEWFLVNEIQWMKTLAELKKYIQSRGKLPSHHSKETKEGYLGRWVCNQQNNYKKVTRIMKNKVIRKRWEVFMNHYPRMFLSNDQQWLETLNDLKRYVASNGRLPSQHSKDATTRFLGQWIITQKVKYKKHTFIMKNPAIRALWEAFLAENVPHTVSSEQLSVDTQTVSSRWDAFRNDNPLLFMYISNEQQWMVTLDCLRQYIAANNQLPDPDAVNPSIQRLAQWLSMQMRNYTSQTEIMNNQIIKTQWETLMNSYPHLFQTTSNLLQWVTTQGSLQQRIAANEALQARYSPDPTTAQVERWLSSHERNDPTQTQERSYEHETRLTKDRVLRY